MYDFPTGEFFSNLAAAPPYGNRTLVTDPAGLFDNPYRDVGGDPHPIITGPNTVFPIAGTFASMDPDINAPRIQSWNVSVERQIDRTGARRPATSEVIPIGCGDSWSSIRACSSVSVRARLAA